jgi:hypothetical protein
MKTIYRLHDENNKTLGTYDNMKKARADLQLSRFRRHLFIAKEIYRDGELVESKTLRVKVS